MKKQTKTRTMFLALSVTVFAFAACNKNDAALQAADATSGDISDATSLASTIAVVASASVADADSVYIMQPCQRGSQRDSIALSDLPASIGTYLTSDYRGYTFNKAFAIKNSNGTVTGYAVVVYFNDKPVGLEFDSTGNFVKVLEQRERGDLSGPGFHHGGRFQHRDGESRDSVALRALPPSVLSYFTANYTSDTLVKAYKNIDSGYVVLSRNNGLYATVFNAAGEYVKREALPAPDHGRPKAIEQAALPTAVTSYLGTTYPGFVFKEAFEVRDNATLKGYMVFINANNTTYAVAFDATGTFVKAKSIF